MMSELIGLATGGALALAASAALKGRFTITLMVCALG